jgi:hypothetical protein
MYAIKNFKNEDRFLGTRDVKERFLTFNTKEQAENWLTKNRNQF